MPRLWSCGEVCPSKFKAFYLGEQQDQESEDTQKEVVYLGNEGSDSDGATEQGEPSIQ